MSPALLDIHELSNAIGYPEAVLARWARMGVIPRVKTSSRVYFNLDRVAEAIRRQQGGATANRSIRPATASATSAR